MSEIIVGLSTSVAGIAAGTGTSDEDSGGCIMPSWGPVDYPLAAL